MKQNTQRAKSQFSRKMNLDALKSSIFDNFALNRDIRLKMKTQEHQRASIISQNEKTKNIINKAKFMTSKHNQVVTEYSKANQKYQKRYKKWGQLR